MPRRGTELVQLPMPPKKKTKAPEELPVLSTPSLDVSFCDDESLRPGIVFTDVNQKKWRLGKPIGKFSHNINPIYLNSVKYVVIRSHSLRQTNLCAS